MLTKDDKRSRIGKIGSSDVATILGLNEYETFYQWMNYYLGLIEPKKETPPLLAGNLFESSIAGFYMAISGNIITPASGKTYVHPDYDWKISHPDYLDKYGNPVEIKNVGQYSEWKWGPDGSTEVPIGPYVQVVDQCIHLGRNTATIVAYFGGADIRSYKLEIPPERKDKLMKQVIEVYQSYIEPGILPEPGGRDLSVLNTRFEGAQESQVVANEEVMRAVTSMKYNKKQLDQIQVEIDESQAMIKNFMGENTVLVDEDGDRVATWKRNKDGEKVDYKALVKDLDVDRTTLSKFTEIRKGARPLKTYNPKKLKEEKDGTK